MSPSSDKKSGVRDEKRSSAPSSETITVHYIKGGDFPALHVDGCFGGVTTRGFIELAFFSERVPIPTQITHSIKSLSGISSTLGKEISREARSGIVRQLEVNLILSENTARDLRTFLDQRLEELNALRGKVEGVKKGATER